MAIRDILLAASGGETYWISVSYANPFNAAIYDINISPTNGSVYACGLSDDSNSNGLITARNNFGEILIAKTLSSSTGVYVQAWSSIEFDSSGGFVCTGTSYTPDAALGVWKFDSSGVSQWTKTFGYSGYYSGIYTDCAIDNSNNIYAIGNFNSSSFNGGGIIKLDSSGSVLWSNQFSPSSYNVSISVDKNNDSNVYACTGAVISSPSVRDGWLAKINPANGNITWQTGLAAPSTGNVELHDLVVDDSGYVYVCGYAPQGGIINPLIAKYDSSGSLQWKISGSSANPCNFTGIYVDGSGNVYACGSITSPYGEGFFAKFNSSGVVQWQYEIAGTNATSTIGLVTAQTNGNNVVYFGGSYTPSSSDSPRDILIKYPSSGGISGTYGGFVITSSAVTFTTSSTTQVTPTDTTSASTYSATAHTETTKDATVSNTITQL